MSYLSSPMSFHLRLMSCAFPCLLEVEEVPVSDVICQKYTTLSVELNFNIVRAIKLPNKTPTQGSRLTN